MEQAESFQQINSFERSAFSTEERSSLIQGFQNFDFASNTSNTSKELLPDVSFFDSRADQGAALADDNSTVQNTPVDDRSRKEPSESPKEPSENTKQPSESPKQPIEQKNPGEEPEPAGRPAPLRPEGLPSPAPVSDDQTQPEPNLKEKIGEDQLPTGEGKGAPSPNETILELLRRKSPF